MAFYRFQVRFLLSLLVLSIISFGCYNLTFVDRFPDQYEEYSKKPNHKALAYAYDWDGAYAVGSAYNYESREEAVKAALLRCRFRKKLHEVEDECTIIYIDDEKQTLD